MSIGELKEIIFQNRCVFLNTKQHCLSDDMSAYDCEECSNKIVDEFVEKIRADEREKTVREIMHYIHNHTENETSEFWHFLFELKDNKGQKNE